MEFLGCVTHKLLFIVSKGSDSQGLEIITSNFIKIFMDPSIENTEALAFRRLLRGTIAMITFSCLILAPHILSFADTLFIDYDDSVNNEEVDEQNQEGACDFSSKDYDEEKCFRENKASVLITITIKIIVYSIPIFGFSEIYVGVSKLYKLKNEPQTQDIELNLDEIRTEAFPSNIKIEAPQPEASEIHLSVVDSQHPAENENTGTGTFGNYAIILLWIIGILSGIFYYRLMINA